MQRYLSYYHLPLAVGAFLSLVSSTHAQERVPIDFKALLGRPFADYDSALGKPLSTSTGGGVGEIRSYGSKDPRISKIIVFRKGDEIIPVRISILFRKGKVKNWKDAMLIAGFNPAGGKLSSDGSMAIEGLKAKPAYFYWHSGMSSAPSPELSIGILPRDLAEGTKREVERRKKEAEAKSGGGNKR